VDTEQQPYLATLPVDALALYNLASYDSTADVALVAGEYSRTLIPEGHLHTQILDIKEQIAEPRHFEIRIVRNPAIQVRNITNPTLFLGGGGLYSLDLASQVPNSDRSEDAGRRTITVTE